MKNSGKPFFPEQKEMFCFRIKKILNHVRPSHKLTRDELALQCGRDSAPVAYDAAIESLLESGQIERLERDYRSGCSYRLIKEKPTFQAKVVRLHKTFGFLHDDQGREFFVRGKYLFGSMPGDIVLARLRPGGEKVHEAQVLGILKENEHLLLRGNIVFGYDDEEFDVPCAFLSRTGNVPMRIDNDLSCDYRKNDVVLAKIVSRGIHHWDHIVQIIHNFGNAEVAEHCVQAMLGEANLQENFAEEIQKEAESVAVLNESEFKNRKDFRNELIFTIDGAHTKDMDDAVSVTKNSETGEYTLGVHIADVSHYVRMNSELDKEAFLRGTSVYYADKVIPMLPKELSNGICSLNPNEDRLAISVIMTFSPKGELLHDAFYSSVIRSRLKGVYEECNQIFDGTASAEIREKYAEIQESLFLLEELTGKLDEIHHQNGRIELESAEAEILLDENHICVGLMPVHSGKTEKLIESCMLSANECAAKFARKKNLPFIYRVHEKPPEENMQKLKDWLSNLHENEFSFSTEDVQPKDIQQLLETCREKKDFPVISNFVLHSMEKAYYSEKPSGHFGLAMKDYTHFTSPIRRYADLMIHRIISDALQGETPERLQKKYEKQVIEAARQASETEIQATRIERNAFAYFAAEFMQSCIGQQFTGMITNIAEYGMYVRLENMAEGLIPVDTLPLEETAILVEESWFVKDVITQQKFQIGDEIQAVCVNAEVSTGHIDLLWAEELPPDEIFY